MDSIGFCEPRPFLSVIPPNANLQELIGLRLFDAVNALKGHGIDIFITRDLRRLVRLNQRNRDSWAPLVPLFDPDQAGFGLDDAFLIEGRDSAGETAFTDGVRLLHLSNSNFKDELESFRLHYLDPMTQKGPDEIIRIVGTRAATITGQTALIGGIWVAPKLRGKGLTQIFTPMARWYAYLLWNMDWVVALLHTALVEKQVGGHYGYEQSEPFIRLDTDSLKATVHLLSQSRGELEAHARIGPQHPLPRLA